MRARHAVLKKTGALKRRFPTKEWEAVGLAELVKDGIPGAPAAYKEFRGRQPRRFFFAPGQVPAEINRVISAEAKARTIGVADDYCRGRFLYFSSQTYDLCWPPDWLCNPFNGARHHANVHWCDYP